MEKQYQNTAAFCRKKCTADELSQSNNPQQSFVIERVVLVSEEDYTDFANNLMEDQYFLFSTTSDMWYEPDTNCWHCVFVTCNEKKEGVLVESEGFSFARYSAFIKDKANLDLAKRPVYDHRPREKQHPKLNRYAR